VKLPALFPAKPQALVCRVAELYGRTPASFPDSSDSAHVLSVRSVYWTFVFSVPETATCQQAALATASINISYRLRISAFIHSPMVVSAHSHAPFVPAMDNYFLELKFLMLLYSRAGAFERFHKSRVIERSNSDETSNDTPLWRIPVNLRLNDRDTGIVLY
jgi:hypothetical protein